MRRFDLVAFDVDGTLISGADGRTVWELLNVRFTGRSDLNVERHASYREGRISYAEWVGLDIGGWKAAGASRQGLVEACAGLSLVAGARETLRALKDAGCKLYVISGTLDLLLEALYPDHPFDEVYANHIGFDSRGRIAHWRATPFDMEGKAKLLRALALREGIPLARCAFVGDSSNDVWIAREAGFSVAVNPRAPELERVAGAVVRCSDLRDILPHLLSASAAAVTDEVATRDVDPQRPRPVRSRR